MHLILLALLAACPSGYIDNCPPDQESNAQSLCCLELPEPPERTLEYNPETEECWDNHQGTVTCGPKKQNEDSHTQKPVRKNKGHKKHL